MDNNSGYVEYDPSVEHDARQEHTISSIKKGAKLGGAFGSVVPGLGNVAGLLIGGTIGAISSLGRGGDQAAADAKKIGIEQMNMENQLITGTREAENISGLGGSPWEVTGTRSSRISPIPGNINPEKTPASQYKEMLKFQNISGVDTLG